MVNTMIYIYQEMIYAVVGFLGHHAGISAQLRCRKHLARQ